MKTTQADPVTEPPKRVWVVMGTEDDGEYGHRYISCVFDSPEKAADT